MCINAHALDQWLHKRNELKAVQSKILSTNKNLSQLQDQKLDVHQQLAELDKNCAQLALSLKAVQQEIEIKNRSVQESKFAIVRQRKEVDIQKDSLAEQLNAAHRMGRHDQLKLLLNQEKLTVSSRVLVYFDYLNKMRSEKIKQIAVDMQQLAQLELQQEQDSLALSEALMQKKRDQAQLLEAKRVRTVLLEQLKSKFKAGQQTLRYLQDDERRLISLLDLLQRKAEQQKPAQVTVKRKAVENIENKVGQAVDSKNDGSEQRIDESSVRRGLELKNQSSNQDPPVEKPTQSIEAFVSAKPFHQLRGQLTWPTHGKILKTFGSLRSEGRWDGVLIGAASGQGVRAVADGRVVYAAWLRSYGLLMIVNHGGGFMTVYAFNEALNKGVGAKVKAGEIIASVGQSGGQSESALYFEIRARGKPLDPSLWCKK